MDKGVSPLKREAADEEQYEPRKRTKLNSLPPSHYIHTPRIKIVVDSGKQEYELHSGLLVAESPFFAAKVKSCWSETTTDVHLPELTKDGFDVVVDWMIEKKLPSRLTEQFTDDERHMARRLTFDAYRAADYLMLPVLQNQLIDNLALALGNRFYPARKLAQLCDLELRHTPLYNFVIDGIVHGMNECAVTELSLDQELDEAEICPRAMKDLLLLMVQWRRQRWELPGRGDMLKYHVPVPKNQGSIDNDF